MSKDIYLKLDSSLIIKKKKNNQMVEVEKKRES